LARLIYSSRALRDQERLADFFIGHNLSIPLMALETLELIEEAVSILQHHPLIGRQVESDLRDLVISRGRTDYLALYSFEAQQNTVLILGIRHQRKVGYVSGE
jgi:plasmid stabilization system protein ParE